MVRKDMLAINTKNLVFDAPHKSENGIIMVNVLSKNTDDIEPYGLLYLFRKPKAHFIFFKNVNFISEFTNFEDEIEQYKMYLVSVIGLSEDEKKGAGMSMDAGTDLVLDFGITIEKKDKEGKVIETKYVNKKEKVA